MRISRVRRIEGAIVSAADACRFAPAVVAFSPASEEVPVRMPESIRRLTPGLFGLLALLCFATSPAYAQCTLSSPSTWNIAGNGTWNTGGDWNPAGVPNSTTTNVCITNGTSTVTLDISPNIANLQLASGNALDMTGNVALTVNGNSIINAGAITMNGG